MSLGQRICQYRTRQGMSQLELAERLEVSRQSISKWETDASVPELEKLVNLCEVFEVTLDELVRGVPQQENRVDTGDREGMTPKAVARMIVGGVLLLCGIMIFVLLWLTLQDFWEGLLIGSAVAVPGIICLKAKEYVWVWCAFAELIIWALVYPLLVLIFSF